jgi:AmmeMemoRadiSam system protein B
MMPSPVPDRPGLLIRDPLGYSEATLIIPPPLVSSLVCFDGEQTELDLRESLVRITGNIEVGDLMRHLIETLGSAGFLQNEVAERLRQERHESFAAAPKRLAAHAAAAYPEQPEALRATLRGYLDGPAEQLGSVADPGSLLGIAAPHVSLEGGQASYRAAYRAAGPRLKGRTFVVLGTSHYGEPETFGLTRKPFVTPLGEAAVDPVLVDRLAQEGGSATRVEDYCHAIEHTIEFQVVFLQHVYGPSIEILPILCGPFANAMQPGARPEDDAGVGRFLEALGGLARREAGRLFWILGIDLAHMGRRYGDPWKAEAGHGPMVAVGERDRHRIERLAACDAAGLWGLVQEEGDPLKWCGSSALYSFLRAVQPTAGELLRYEQWNIDPHSVVSFAAMAFFGAARAGSPSAPAA